MRFGVATVAALVAAGCTSIAADQRTFDGTSWRVMALNGRATPATENYRVRFQESQMGGQFGCNHFGGPYRVDGDIMTVGPVAVTEMACIGPAGDFESWGLRTLQQPMRMSWAAGRRLTLANQAGSIALELDR